MDYSQKGRSGGRRSISTELDPVEEEGEALERSREYETSSQSPRAQKKATSSNAPSVATGANGEPQGKDLHSIASRITSPEIHLTSRISQRHDDLSNGAREYLRLKTKESQSSLPIPLFISLSQATSPAQIKTNVVLLLGTLPVLFFYLFTYESTIIYSLDLRSKPQTNDKSTIDN
ncbi:hypothetical protein Pst134EA_022685 [Puccinia striiformis f. sp. tritici]|uniref:hypothetical protein n=1 Tax=Puccinia striiformis f. sp. tritici TaxID=168172 RepID=UPI0020088893|nr:hypothetical protein Pst134EA_022685 [Puccinia striiformis f. sp. tritici]KAH9455212.1 hypothetical protein Pst134EA_022685 [Puccinia striiformis f. sp. tritici]